MRILAIQTDAYVLELLVQLLIDRTDYDAVAAQTRDAARSLLADSATLPLDCALIDGDIACRETRAFIADLRAQSDMPILVMTTDTSKPELDALFAAGATDVVTKPFEISTLRGKLALLKPAPVSAETDSVARQTPLPIFGVPGVLPLFSFENYGTQIVRHRHAGSCVFGVALNDISRLHRQLSPFAFHSMITDVADAISTAFAEASCLTTYAGDGVFLCIIDAETGPQTAGLTAAINTELAAAGICDDADLPLRLHLTPGHALRLGTGRSSCVTIAEARQSAERARRTAEGYVAPFVLMDRIA